MVKKNVLKILCAGVVLFSAAFAAWNGFGASSGAEIAADDSAQNAFVRVRGGGVRRVNGRDFAATGGVVRVEANPGWRLLSPSVLELGRGGPVRYRVRDYSGENTPGGNIDGERTETTETHVSAPRIAAQIDCRGPWVYAASQTQVDFANAVFGGTLVTNGVHRRRTRTYRNGILVSEEVRYVAMEPNRWTWAWRLGPTQGSQWGETFSRHLSSVTAGVYAVTGAVTAVNTACRKCEASATAKENLIVSELTVSCDAYIGQDRTGDPARPYKSPSVRAVAHLTPANPSVGSVDWTYGGGCERSRDSGMSLELWTTNREYASPRHLGEVVRAKVGNASVSTNFTVVKVDVAAGNVSENDEGNVGAFVPCVEDANGDDALSESGSNALVAVSLACQPTNLPDNLPVKIASPRLHLYAKHGDRYYGLPGELSLGVSKLKQLSFYLHGHSASASLRDKVLEIRHPASGAKDTCNFTGVELDFDVVSDKVAPYDDVSDGKLIDSRTATVTVSTTPKVDDLSGLGISFRSEPVRQDDLINELNKMDISFSHLSNNVWKTPKVYWYGIMPEWECASYSYPYRIFLQVNGCDMKRKEYGAKWPETNAYAVWIPPLVNGTTYEPAKFYRSTSVEYWFCEIKFVEFEKEDPGIIYTEPILSDPNSGTNKFNWTGQYAKQIKKEEEFHLKQALGTVPFEMGGATDCYTIMGLKYFIEQQAQANSNIATSTWIVKGSTAQKAENNAKKVIDKAISEEIKESRRVWKENRGFIEMKAKEHAGYNAAYRYHCDYLKRYGKGPLHIRHKAYGKENIQ